MNPKSFLLIQSLVGAFQIKSLELFGVRDLSESLIKSFSPLFRCCT